MTKKLNMGTRMINKLMFRNKYFKCRNNKLKIVIMNNMEFKVRNSYFREALTIHKKY